MMVPLSEFELMASRHFTVEVADIFFQVPVPSIVFWHILMPETPTQRIESRFVMMV